MSNGYHLYSFDRNRFERFVEHPTSGQLEVLGRLLRERLNEHLEEMGEFKRDDPVRKWPTDAGGLARVAQERLAKPDWYRDLSRDGKDLWAGVFALACSGVHGIPLRFRVESNGVYWDIIELAWKHLKVVPGKITDLAMSTFGTRPYRYRPTRQTRMTREEYDRQGPLRRKGSDLFDQAMDQARKNLSAQHEKQAAPNPMPSLLQMFQDPEAFQRIFTEAANRSMEALASAPAMVKLGKLTDKYPHAGAPFREWSAGHSMHPPDEVARMVGELESVEKQIKKEGGKQVQQDYDEELLPALRRVADQGRMLFVM
jgi:hypothetical protein